MNKEEKEQWLYEAYQYTSNFDFNRLDKYEEANDDICIDDLILDYTMLYEFHKEEIEQLNNIIKEKNKVFELLRKAQLKKCQEYEDLEKLNNANYQSFIEVNNIINKAIDFLKENACIDEDVEYFCDDLRYDDCKKLLNILKGEDKE